MEYLLDHAERQGSSLLLCSRHYVPDITFYSYLRLVDDIIGIAWLLSGQMLKPQVLVQLTNSPK